MANKQYQIAFLLGAKVQSSMGSAFGTANRQLSSLQKSAASTNKAFGNIGKGIGSMIKAAAGIAGAYLSFNAAKDFASESVSAAKDQLEQETKLEAVLKNVKTLQAQGPTAYKKAKDELVGVSSQLQNVGVIGDDVALAGFQQLATFQLSNKEISVLSGGMADLLAQQKGLNATSGDAVTIANMIGKAMSGNVGALSRVGISFTKAQEKAIKTGNATKRAATIAEVLKDNVGGVSKALRETDEGKIWSMNNGWSEMQETIGMKLLPIQAKFAGWFADKVPKIQNIILSAVDFISGKFDKFSSFANTTIIPRIKDIVNIVGQIADTYFPNAGGAADDLEQGLGSLAVNGLDAVKNGLTWIRDNGPIVVGVVKGLTYAFIIYKSIMIAAAAAQTAHNIAVGISNTLAVISTGYIKAVAAAQWLLNAAMNANPLSLAIVLATGLIAVISTLWHTNEGFKNFVTAMFNTIKSGLINMVNSGITWINKLISLLNKIPGVHIGQISLIDTGENSPVLNSKGQVRGARPLASGGYVRHTPGGILANIAEGGEDEVVSPVSKLKKLLNVSSKDDNKPIQVVYQINIQGNADEDAIYRGIKKGNDDLEKRIDKIKAKRDRLSLNPA